MSRSNRDHEPQTLSESADRLSVAWRNFVQEIARAPLLTRAFDWMTSPRPLNRACLWALVFIVGAYIATAMYLTAQGG